ncbi:MAG: hypothetical protein RJA10_1619, partial [Pseudomonadota bacterium]
QPDVVIAVNVGSPLLKAESVGSLLTVTAQMVNILTEQNVRRSIDSLTPRDVYLRPDLDGITAADFDLHAEAAARGRTAAERVASQLAGLSLPPADYDAWRQRFVQAPRTPPRVDAIEIAGLSRVQPDIVRRHLRQEAGQTLDSIRLSRDLVRVYGEGDFEGVDYRLVSEGTRHVLRILPAEKKWGPDYLRVGLSLSSTLSQGASYSLRAAWHKTWINRWGGEWLAVGELGDTNGASMEWFQPLGTHSPWFTDAALRFRRHRLDIFASDLRVSEYVFEKSSLGLKAGLNLGALGQFHGGWHLTRWHPSLATGLPLIEGRQALHHGLQAGLEIDRLSRRFFPTDGWSLRVDAVDNRGDGGGYTRASVDLRNAWSQGPWVIGTRAAWTGSPRGQLPLYDGASLGGFLNLSAFSANQVSGDSIRYGHLRAERVIGTMPAGLRGDMRVGAGLELGQVGGSFVQTRHTGLLKSLVLYLGGDTPLGPVYLGAATSLSGVVNAYLFIGSP